VRTPDGRHLDDLPLDEFDPVILGQDAGLAHSIVFLHCEAPGARFRCHAGSFVGIIASAPGVRQTVEHRIAQEETVIVDTHVHPLAADRARYPLSPPEGSGPDWYTEMHFTAEECLEQMALSGVDQMVLVSSYSAYTNDNSYAADAAASSPAHFAGVCRIDPLAPDAPETLSYWIEERGMCGVRLGSADRVQVLAGTARSLFPALSTDMRRPGH
jgi:hypothetical protein